MQYREHAGEDKDEGYAMAIMRAKKPGNVWRWDPYTNAAAHGPLLGAVPERWADRPPTCEMVDKSLLQA